MNRQTVGMLQIMLAALLFGLVPIFVRLTSGIDSYTLSFSRIAVAAIALYVFFLFSKKYPLAPFKKERSKMLLFGALHGFIIVGYFISIKYLSIASAMLLLYSSSIWIIVFSYFILKEKISWTTMLALVLSIVGVVLILSPQDFFLKESIIGSASGLLAAIGFGLVYVLSKTFKSYDKISLTFWQNVIALPFLIPLLFMHVPTILAFSLQNILMIAALGIFCTVIPFILVFKGFEKVDAQKGGIAILLDIVFALVFAMFLFNEMPSMLTILGALFIMAGSYLASR